MSQKRFIIVHGWAGAPDQLWFPWLKQELEKRGCQVELPTLPNAFFPKIEEWVPFLSEFVKEPDERTYFIGHSTGCQTILRYLETLPDNVKVGGVILVAPFLTLDTLEREFMRPWVETAIDFEKVKLHASNIVTIFSENDFMVPIRNKELFEISLPSKMVVVKNYNHFITMKELPLVLEEAEKWL